MCPHIPSPSGFPSFYSNHWKLILSRLQCWIPPVPFFFVYTFVQPLYKGSQWRTHVVGAHGMMMMCLPIIASATLVDGFFPDELKFYICWWRSRSVLFKLPAPLKIKYSVPLVCLRYLKWIAKCICFFPLPLKLSCSCMFILEGGLCLPWCRDCLCFLPICSVSN